MSDGAIFTGDCGAYQLADGRILLTVGNPGVNAPISVADDIATYLSSNPGVTVSQVNLDNIGTATNPYQFGGGNQHTYYIGNDYAPWEGIHWSV